MLRPYLSRVRPCTGPDPAQFDHMRPDLDPKLVQEHLAHRAAGHPGHRFPRARALQDVARVLPVVLERAREPDSGSGSRDLHAVPPLHVVERGQGVRPHGRRGACGLVFVMVGSETTTSPRAVMPNRYCWPLVASNATRSGPMIGSRIAIFRCWLKKNVSNTRMLVSGDAANTMRSAMFPEPPPQVTGPQVGPGSKLWL